jgi:hypothetical protein
MIKTLMPICKCPTCLSLPDSLAISSFSLLNLSCSSNTAPTSGRLYKNACSSESSESRSLRSASGKAERVGYRVRRGVDMVGVGVVATLENSVAVVNWEVEVVALFNLA